MRVMGAQRKGAKSKFKESSKVGFRKLQISRDLRQKRKGDDRGWDGWMASPTWWTWVWVNSGVGDGQGGLACCSSWGCKELDMTERLNWTDLNRVYTSQCYSLNLSHPLLPFPPLSNYQCLPQELFFSATFQGLGSPLGPILGSLPFFLEEIIHTYDFSYCLDVGNIHVSPGSTGYVYSIASLLEVSWNDVKVKVAPSCLTLQLYSPWNSLGQNTGVGSLCLLQGNLPDPGIEPGSPALQADSLPTELPGKPLPRFDPWVSEILWRRKWQPTPVFLPGKSQGQRSLVGYSPWGLKKPSMNDWLNNKI